MLLMKYHPAREEQEIEQEDDLEEGEIDESVDNVWDVLEREFSSSSKLEKCWYDRSATVRQIYSGWDASMSLMHQTTRIRLRSSSEWAQTTSSSARLDT